MIAEVGGGAVVPEKVRSIVDLIIAQQREIERLKRYEQQHETMVEAFYAQGAEIERLHAGIREAVGNRYSSDVFEELLSKLIGTK